MDVPELMTVMAAQIARIPGVGGRAHYPPVDRITASPTVIVRQSNEQPTTYEKARAGQQMVLASIDVLILVEKVNEGQRPRDEAKIDTLITPILDYFDMSADGGSVNSRLPGLSGHVDRIWASAPVRRGVIEWGVQNCYAAVITMDAKFRRQPQTIVLEELP